MAPDAKGTTTRTRRRTAPEAAEASPPVAAHGLRGLGHRLYTGEVSADFVGRKRVWYLISAVLIVVSIVGLGVFRLHLGIEFRGGADFQVPVSSTPAGITDTYRQTVLDTGLPDLDDTTVTTIGSTQVRVETRSLDTTTEVPKVRSALAAKAGINSTQVAYSLIGPTWGQQITQRAALALVIFLVLVMVVIWASFRDWKMSVAAIVALLHDLVITVGVYALVGFTVTPATVIGVLTILGYSLYDTVVVFDKVRENVRSITGSAVRTYSEAANLAVNQVLVRSINTTVIGILPVAALLFAGAFILGEGPLKDLALALFVGMISGAYSSIFIATPLLAQMREREPQMIKLRRRVEARRARSANRDASTATVAQAAEPDATIEPDQTPEPVATRAGRWPRGRYDNDDLLAAEAQVASMADETGRPTTRGTTRAADEPDPRIGVDVVGDGADGPLLGTLPAGSVRVPARSAGGSGNRERRGRPNTRRTPADTRPGAGDSAADDAVGDDVVADELVAPGDTGEESKDDAARPATPAGAAAGATPDDEDTTNEGPAGEGTRGERLRRSQPSRTSRTKRKK